MKTETMLLIGVLAVAGVGAVYFLTKEKPRKPTTGELWGAAFSSVVDLFA